MDWLRPPGVVRLPPPIGLRQGSVYPAQQREQGKTKGGQTLSCFYFLSASAAVFPLTPPPSPCPRTQMTFWTLPNFLHSCIKQQKPRLEGGMHCRARASDVVALTTWLHQLFSLWQFGNWNDQTLRSHSQTLQQFSLVWSLSRWKTFPGAAQKAEKTVKNSRSCTSK